MKRREQGVSHDRKDRNWIADICVEAMSPRIDRAPYLFGEHLSVADILLTTCLDWAVASGFALPKQAADYRFRLSRRSAYQAALKQNFSQSPS
jgi:glutathione S-transferase